MINTSNLYSHDEKNQFLIVAALHGNIEDIKALLSDGANIETKLDNFTPLLFAIKNGHLEAMKYLIKCGAHLNNKENEENILSCAVRYDHLHIIKYLVEIGQCLKSCHPLTFFGAYKKHNLVSLAIKNKNSEMLKYLIDNRATCEYSTSTNNLEEAIDTGSLEMVKLLVDAGADINSRGVLQHLILNTALTLNHYDIAYYLIDHGINIIELYKSAYVTTDRKRIIEDYIKSKELKNKLSKELDNKEEKKDKEIISTIREKI